ncbi:hypothetical protein Y1Q_0002764 [Alligator mississippiensis]|uniref:Uncharacterized protein n=1 Tax=Alligator mississippiensis TaxID=8496 RepID=A0A151NZW4_ALLMI|nr:hypothetical protein Y1Q_0002764 [Alligator mississippiensis]
MPRAFPRQLENGGARLSAGRRGGGGAAEPGRTHEIFLKREIFTRLLLDCLTQENIRTPGCSILHVSVCIWWERFFRDLQNSIKEGNLYFWASM